MKDLNQLLSAYQKLSASLPLWTQGQGSNLSVKDPGRRQLWIKPSGYRLDGVRGASDLVQIDLNQLPSDWKALSQEQYAQAIKAAQVGTSDKRPSMETGFHAVLKGDYVFHFHSLAGILMEYRKSESAAWLREKWSSGDFHFVEYVTPGLDLTAAIEKHPDATLFFLKQHGVILAGAQASVLDQWMALEADWMHETYGVRWPLTASFDELTMKFASGDLKVLFPDMAVYLTRMPQVLERDGQSWKLKAGARSLESNLTELWVATQFLLALEKDLPEISESEIQKITGLPTEQFRMLGKK